MVNHIMGEEAKLFLHVKVLLALCLLLCLLHVYIISLASTALFGDVVVIVTIVTTSSQMPFSMVHNKCDNYT